MGKIVVTEFVSLDGIVEDPGGAEAGAPAGWPAIQDEAGFAAKMNQMPKYVVSKTLHNPTWNNTTVLSGDPVAEITALKDKAARDILVAGSSQLVHLLASNDLVDQYNLMIFPVLLGSGRKLFPDAGLEVPARFKVTTVKQAGDVLWVVLERDRSTS